ncbi:MAG TPA: ABC transporter permease, partial [Spirochaetaceae bacterium]|nr:ABC transporter permease [Spirochaetaceae bacterium]
GARTGPSLLPSAAGIAIGVTALIVIVGVMNGFQFGFIDAVLELDSYHLRAEPKALGIEEAAIRARAAKGVASALPFIDIRSLAVNDRGRTEGLRIKVVPDDAPALDPAIASLSYRTGGFSAAGGIVIGSELARRLNLREGDSLSILSVSADEDEGISSSLVKLRVGGVFHTGFYDFDSGLSFLAASSAAELAQGEMPMLGIKLIDRYDDHRLSRVLEDAGFEAAAIESWRSYNRAFFGALRMEKSIMMALVGLIFIVVGVNIFHAMRKAVYGRMEEIAILKALGGKPGAVRLIFLLNGSLAGLGGALVGLAFGLAIAYNVNAVFSGIEGLLEFLATMVGQEQGFRFFSPELFYLADVPVSLPPAELAFITLSGALSALAAAWAASTRLSSYLPSEVLRNE